MEITRTCVVTRKKLPRHLLYKICKDKDGNVSIDLSYSKQGRSAYLSKDKAVILSAKKKDSLSKALKMKVDMSIYDELLEIVEGENYGKE